MLKSSENIILAMRKSEGMTRKSELVIVWKMCGNWYGIWVWNLRYISTNFWEKFLFEFLYLLPIWSQFLQIFKGNYFISFFSNTSWILHYSGTYVNNQKLFVRQSYIYVEVPKYAIPFYIEEIKNTFIKL